MTRTPFEAGKLLAWLGEMLQGTGAVDIDVVVVDTSGSRSSVQIILHDVPGPLGGFQVRPTTRLSRAPVSASSPGGRDDSMPSHITAVL